MINLSIWVFLLKLDFDWENDYFAFWADSLVMVDFLLFLISLMMTSLEIKSKRKRKMYKYVIFLVKLKKDILLDRFSKIKLKKYYFFKNIKFFNFLKLQIQYSLLF